MHTPNKTLVLIVNISSDESPQYRDAAEYKRFYQNNDFSLTLSPKNFNFESAVVYNNYELFITKIVHVILSI
jgi:hypothetical protein